MHEEQRFGRSVPDPCPGHRPDIVSIFASELNIERAVVDIDFDQFSRLVHRFGPASLLLPSLLFRLVLWFWLCLGLLCNLLANNPHSVTWLRVPADRAIPTAHELLLRFPGVEQLVRIASNIVFVRIPCEECFAALHQGESCVGFIVDFKRALLVWTARNPTLLHVYSRWQLHGSLQNLFADIVKYLQHGSAS